MQPNNQVQKPFFARFLENQADAKATTAQQEERLSGQLTETQTTLKFPSDWDDADWG